MKNEYKKDFLAISHLRLESLQFKLKECPLSLFSRVDDFAHAIFLVKSVVFTKKDELFTNTDKIQHDPP